jgi:hypothetical protein
VSDALFPNKAQFTNTRKGLEHRFTSGQHDDMQKGVAEENYTKLVIDWRHLQDDRWFVLQSARIATKLLHLRPYNSA